MDEEFGQYLHDAVTVAEWDNKGVFGRVEQHPSKQFNIETLAFHWFGDEVSVREEQQLGPAFRSVKNFKLTVNEFEERYGIKDMRKRLDAYKKKED